MVMQGVSGCRLPRVLISGLDETSAAEAGKDVSIGCKDETPMNRKELLLQLRLPHLDLVITMTTGRAK